MVILLVVLGIFLGLLLLSILEVRSEARKRGERLGFWQSIRRGVTNLFGHLLDGIASGIDF